MPELEEMKKILKEFRRAHISINESGKSSELKMRRFDSALSELINLCDRLLEEEKDA